ncbi:MAG: GAF domain-containing protein [Armatimonadetes bacterium]|nr:GAF domain-containing protein [Armatimonadota bacterium]
MKRLFEAWAECANERERLAHAAQFLKGLAKADACDILTASPGGGLVLAASTFDPELIERIRLAKGVGLAGRAYTSGRKIDIESDLPSHHESRHVEEFDLPEFVSARIIPYRSSEDNSGVVFLRKRGLWPADDLEDPELELAVHRAMSALAGFQAGFASGSHLNKLDALSEVARSLTESPYLEEVLQLLVNLTAKRFNYRVVTVRLLDAERGELILRATQATNKAYQRKRAIKLGESIAGKAIQLRKPVFIDDVRHEADYIGHDLAEEQGLRSMVCIPLIVQNRPVGVMSCYTGEIRQFGEDEISILETLAKQAAVSIEHTRLQVRNTLMQEMHHRVKNNLQQVASLLRLQLRQSHYKSMEEALQDSLSRIQAIAAVHELLSRDDLDHVSLKHIAETLGHHQQQSFIMPGKSIRFSVRGDDVHLNTNQATQVALILNEMIQNAVEHGFERAARGEIHITIEELDGEIGIWVSNDGDPLPAEFDPVQGGQLGLQIIRSLSGALGGTFKIENRLGWTVCEVKFTRQLAE